MSKRIVFHEGALQDYQETFVWYAKRSVTAAVRFRREVDEACERIVADPQRYPRHTRDRQFCTLEHFPVRLIYREEADQIVVLAVFHGKRHARHWRRRN